MNEQLNKGNKKPQARMDVLEAFCDIREKDGSKVVLNLKEMQLAEVVNKCTSKIHGGVV